MVRVAPRNRRAHRRRSPLLCPLADQMGSSSSPIASTFNFSSIPFPNPRIRFHVSYQYNQKFQVTNKKVFKKNAAAVSLAAPTRIRRLTRVQVNLVKCSSSSSSNENQSETGSSLEDILSGMVDERVEQLLNREENRVLLDGLEKATHRVEMAKKELAEIQRQELEAKLLRDYVNKVHSTTSQVLFLLSLTFSLSPLQILVQLLHCFGPQIIPDLIGSSAIELL